MTVDIRTDGNQPAGIPAAAHNVSLTVDGKNLPFTEFELKAKAGEVVQGRFTVPLEVLDILQVSGTFTLAEIIPSQVTEADLAAIEKRLSAPRGHWNQCDPKRLAAACFNALVARLTAPKK